MRNYTDEQVEKMNEAFKLVQNKDHWKNPINKVLPLTDEQKELVYEAVIFYTGSVPTITKLNNGQYRVTAIGYFMAVGA